MEENKKHAHHHDENHECCGGHGHHHYDENHECCGGHGHHHHDAEDIFTSLGFKTNTRYTEADLKTMLTQLDELAVLRAKGIVQTPEDTWLFFDYVPGEINIRSGAANESGMITVIGTVLDESQLKEIFKVQ